MHYESYHELLIEEFEQRKLVNGSYSMRAFARDLGLSAPRLNLVLAKKQGLSMKAAEQIASKMKLDKETRDWFCLSVGAQHSRSQKERANYQKRISEYKHTEKKFSLIQLEFFKVISNWYHFAILELTYLDDFIYDIDWISNKLGISANEARSAIDRLIKLELLKEENETLIDQFKFLTTPNDTPSASLKMFNVQIMKKAMVALQEQSVSDREIAANVFAMDKADLPKIKEKLRSFRRELEYEASKSKTKNSVYCLSMQFHELTRRGE
tara:strand:+ start:2415 stop:3218 length:804 start_codon:yes stop_codon:yes gene_type:complete